jgi:hypothetical protein
VKLPRRIAIERIRKRWAVTDDLSRLQRYPAVRTGRDMPGALTAAD